ncbi:tumor protein p53-inducible nuclear protein 1 isoform X4 [Myotis daubentonii]|nr:tumor protein p53-inducible nuclear protein 1 isoform X4 [Myotis daubentonii]
MEESWFITPPPCFTAGGLTTLKVETSPMENLLIEHPSMSVYAVHNSCPGLHEASCGADELHNASGPRYVGQEKLLIRLTGTEVEAQNEVGQHIHCYVAAVAAHAAFLEQPKSFRPSQWIKEHSERQALNRNSLRRQNLTRDCHSRQVKHSGWAVHQPCPQRVEGKGRATPPCICPVPGRDTGHPAAHLGVVPVPYVSSISAPSALPSTYTLNAATSHQPQPPILSRLPGSHGSTNCSPHSHTMIDLDHRSIG